MELSAKDLRIGNLFEYRIQDKLDERKDWWEVSIIDSNDIAILESNIDYDYRPIPLTEDWLNKKLGFKKDKNKFNTIYKKEDFTLLLAENVGWIFYYKGHPIKIIYFVHKLQNLCFELTEKELEIK